MRGRPSVSHHPAESARIDVRAGDDSFACGECHDEVLVPIASPEDVLEAWQAFARDHHGCAAARPDGDTTG
jgi:hypothetical protein